MRILYEKPTKEQKEESFFKNFIDLEKSIPHGKWEKSERPDYLLKYSGGVIGLEITALSNSKRSEIRSAQDKVFQKAMQIAEEKCLPIMEVTAKFRADSNKINIENAAIELVNIIQSKLCEITNDNIYYLQDFGGKYFSIIFANLGTINGINWLKNHRWHHSYMNFVSIDPINDLQNTIDVKSKKINEYLKHCDECWLLIGVDEWSASEAVDLTEKGINHVYISRFKKTFFLRNIDSKLVYLNTKES